MTGRPAGAFRGQAAGARPGRSANPTRLLLSHHLGIRFAALFGLAAGAFLIAQTIAYLWLPEGLLRGASVGAVVTGDEAAGSFAVEWGRIVAWNLLVLGLVFVAPNLLRSASGIPLAYLPAVTMSAFMGMITGTNSFTMAAEVGKIAPSIVEWVSNPGFYEILAFVLAAAATYDIARWQVVKTGRMESTVKAHPVDGGWGNGQLRVGLVAAIGILLAADAWEARLILGL